MTKEKLHGKYSIGGVVLILGKGRGDSRLAGLREREGWGWGWRMGGWERVFGGVWMG